MAPRSSVGGGGAGSVFAGAAGFGGTTVASSDLRMREMGGRTSGFVFTSPSSVFLRGFFVSMRDTLPASWRGAGAVCGATFADDGSAARSLTGAPAPPCGGSASVFRFFFETLDTGAAAGLWTAAVLRAAGLRAGLLLVFVAIVVPLKFRSWLERLNQSHITARPLLDGPPRESHALSSRPPRVCQQNPAHPRRAILPNW